MTDQSTGAKPNITEDAEIKDNLSSSEETNVVEINNSNYEDTESDNSSSSDGNESSKNHSTPGFRLLGCLVCLYIGWQFRKQ
jgi:hypothetical protein